MNLAILGVVTFVLFSFCLILGVKAQNPDQEWLFEYAIS